MRYLVGQRLRFSIVVTNLITGLATDPANLTLVLQSSSGNTTYTYPSGSDIVRDSLGNFHCDFTPTVTGNWNYRWSSTGTVVAAAESQFSIQPSRL